MVCMLILEMWAVRTTFLSLPLPLGNLELAFESNAVILSAWTPEERPSLPFLPTKPLTNKIYIKHCWHHFLHFYHFESLFFFFWSEVRYTQINKIRPMFWASRWSDDMTLPAHLCREHWRRRSKALPFVVDETGRLPPRGKFNNCVSRGEKACNFKTGV